MKLFEVIVLKFKSIANYQVTHLLETSTATNANTNVTSMVAASNTAITTTASSAKVEPTTNSLPAAVEKSDADQSGLSQQERKMYIEKLDAFINAFEDKDRVKVI